jgi:hypothetical protein
MASAFVCSRLLFVNADGAEKPSHQALNEANNQSSTCYTEMPLQDSDEETGKELINKSQRRVS